jgi:hypothetical protein
MKPIEALGSFVPSVDRSATHYAEAHFPGLYSIVLCRNNGLLTRMFIARPGQLHADLMSDAGKFLWHAHGYDFRETTTIAGCVTNINVTPAYDGRPFYQYQINAGIDSGQRPTITQLPRKVTMGLMSVIEYPVGSSYTLDASVIHRVVFTPDAETGWFACMVQELKKRPAPDIVYSPHDLDDIPDADKLYRKIDNTEAQQLLTDLMESQ